MKTAKSVVINHPGLKRKDQIINFLAENANTIEGLAICYMHRAEDGELLATSEFTTEINQFASIPSIDYAIYMLNVIKSRLLNE